MMFEVSSSHRGCCWSLCSLTQSVFSPSFPPHRIRVNPRERGGVKLMEKFLFLSWSSSSTLGVRVVRRGLNNSPTSRASSSPPPNVTTHRMGFLADSNTSLSHVSRLQLPYSSIHVIHLAGRGPAPALTRTFFFRVRCDRQCLQPSRPQVDQIY
jgi:hypothetical protein